MNGMHRMHSCDQVCLFYFIPIIPLPGAECLEYILLYLRIGIYGRSMKQTFQIIQCTGIPTCISKIIIVVNQIHPYTVVVNLPGALLVLINKDTS